MVGATGPSWRGEASPWGFSDHREWSRRRAAIPKIHFGNSLSSNPVEFLPTGALPLPAPPPNAPIRSITDFSNPIPLNGSRTSMKTTLPALRAIMDRGILVNYRVDPLILDRLVPRPFRVKRIHCWGLASVLLIRLRNSPPTGGPEALGQTTENATYQVAVQRDEDGIAREGVYILSRHTNSRPNALAEWRIFPGAHELARFNIHECGGLHKIELQTRREDQDLKLLCRESDNWPAGSIFTDQDEAWESFRRGCPGDSPTPEMELHGRTKLHPLAWRMTPMRVDHIDAPFFRNPRLFPPGSTHLDSVLLMRDLDHLSQTAPDVSSGESNVTLSLPPTHIMKN